VSGLEVYDADSYLRAGRNKASVIDFIRYAKDTEELVHQKGWHLETRFTSITAVSRLDSLPLSV
jgi:hypothetical protein